MKIEKLESIRGFVALYIVLHHFVLIYSTPETPKIISLFFNHPQEAVLIFFLLSGFVIYISAFNKGYQSWFIFIKKRFVRIYPIAICAFIISTVIFALNGYHFVKADFTTLIGNLFMLQDLTNNPGLIVPTYLDNYPLWSLSYEWWFYMLFLFFFSYLKDMKTSRSILFVLLFSLAGWFLYYNYPNHLFLIVAYYLLWWAGVECAKIYLATNTFELKTLWPILGSILIMCIVLGFPILKGRLIEHKTLLQINAIYPFSTYLHFYLSTLIVLTLGLCWWKFRLKYFDTIFGGFRKLSSISFALYIIHFPIIWLKIPFITNVLLLIVVKLCIIFFISYLLEIKMQPMVSSYFNKKRLKN
jgi:peptidoglycan/LPS O-acetylase OafA/YrhL